MCRSDPFARSHRRTGIILTIPFLRSFPLGLRDRNSHICTLLRPSVVAPLLSRSLPNPDPIPCTLANATTISIGAEKGLGTACCAANHPFLQVLRGGDAGKQPSGGRARRSDRRPRPRPSSSSDGRNKRQVPGIGSGPWWEGRTSSVPPPAFRVRDFLARFWGLGTGGNGE